MHQYISVLFFSLSCCLFSEIKQQIQILTALIFCFTKNREMVLFYIYIYIIFVQLSSKNSGVSVSWSGSRRSGVKTMRIGSCRYVTSRYLHYIHALLIPSCTISTSSGLQSNDCDTKTERGREREREGKGKRKRYIFYNSIHNGGP